jgi:acyl-CoA-binding protein/uncharacterized protein YbdZ (MbtH family)
MGNAESLEKAGENKAKALDQRKKDLIEFYNKVDPERLNAAGNADSAADSLLATYKFHDIVRSLNNKYKACPAGWNEQAAQCKALTDFYKKHDPTRVQAVDDLLLQYPLADIKTSLHAKYGALPAGWEGGDGKTVNTPVAGGASNAVSDKAARKQELTAFYKKHDPSKISSVDTILQNYAFHAVVTSLQTKYGELPAGWEATDNSFSSASKGGGAGSLMGSGTEFMDALAAFDAHDSKFERSLDQRTVSDAVHKQATQGDCTLAAPGIFSSNEDRAKYNAWEQLRGVSTSEAEEKYVDLHYQQLKSADPLQRPHITSEFADAVAAVAEYDGKYERGLQKQLVLSALYAQATKGDARDDSKPGFFDDAQAVEEWKAWAGKRGMPKSRAVIGYVEEARRQMANTN